MTTILFKVHTIEIYYVFISVVTWTHRNCPSPAHITESKRNDEKQAKCGFWKKIKKQQQHTYRLVLNERRSMINRTVFCSALAVWICVLYVRIHFKATLSASKLNCKLLLLHIIFFFLFAFLYRYNTNFISVWLLHCAVVVGTVEPWHSLMSIRTHRIAMFSKLQCHSK